MNRGGNTVKRDESRFYDVFLVLLFAIIITFTMFAP